VRPVRGGSHWPFDRPHKLRRVHAPAAAAAVRGVAADPSYPRSTVSGFEHSTAGDRKYFYAQAVDGYGNKYWTSPGGKFQLKVR